MGIADDLIRTTSTNKVVDVQRDKKVNDAVTRLRDNIAEKDRKSREELEKRYSSTPPKSPPL